PIEQLVSYAILLDIPKSESCITSCPDVYEQYPFGILCVPQIWPNLWRHGILWSRAQLAIELCRFVNGKSRQQIRGVQVMHFRSARTRNQHASAISAQRNIRRELVPRKRADLLSCFQVPHHGGRVSVNQ